MGKVDRHSRGVFRGRGVADGMRQSHSQIRQHGEAPREKDGLMATTDIASRIMQEEILDRIDMILVSAAPSTDPCKHIQEVGEAIRKIGECLSGMSLQDARRVLRAVQALQPT